MIIKFVVRLSIEQEKPSSFSKILQKQEDTRLYFKYYFILLYSIQRLVCTDEAFTA